MLYVFCVCVYACACVRVRMCVYACMIYKKTAKNPRKTAKNSTPPSIKKTFSHDDRRRQIYI